MLNNQRVSTKKNTGVHWHLPRVMVNWGSGYFILLPTRKNESTSKSIAWSCPNVPSPNTLWASRKTLKIPSKHDWTSLGEHLKPSWHFKKKPLGHWIWELSELWNIISNGSSVIQRHVFIYLTCRSPQFQHNHNIITSGPKLLPTPYQKKLYKWWQMLVLLYYL